MHLVSLIKIIFNGFPLLQPKGIKTTPEYHTPIDEWGYASMSEVFLENWNYDWAKTFI
jgi:hypothetical protein